MSHSKRFIVQATGKSQKIFHLIYFSLSKQLIAIESDATTCCNNKGMQHETATQFVAVCSLRFCLESFLLCTVLPDLLICCSRFQVAAQPASAISGFWEKFFFILYSECAYIFFWQSWGYFGTYRWRRCAMPRALI